MKYSLLGLFLLATLSLATLSNHGFSVEKTQIQLTLVGTISGDARKKDDAGVAVIRDSGVQGARTMTVRVGDSFLSQDGHHYRLRAIRKDHVLVERPDGSGFNVTYASPDRNITTDEDTSTTLGLVDDEAFDAVDSLEDDDFESEVVEAPDALDPNTTKSRGSRAPLVRSQPPRPKAVGEDTAALREHLDSILMNDNTDDDSTNKEPTAIEDDNRNQRDDRNPWIQEGDAQ